MNTDAATTTKKSEGLRVFLCHSSGDKPIVRNLCRRLKEDGFAPWLDEQELLPGQEWQEEIPNAVRACDVVLVCLSLKSINKEGYLQREIRDALSVAEEKPDGMIFVIPIRLEEVEVPKRLSKWQWADLFEPHGYQQLVRSLNARASSMSIMVTSQQMPEREHEKPLGVKEPKNLDIQTIKHLPIMLSSQLDVSTEKSSKLTGVEFWGGRIALAVLQFIRRRPEYSPIGYIAAAVGTVCGFSYFAFAAYQESRSRFSHIEDPFASAEGYLFLLVVALVQIWLRSLVGWIFMMLALLGTVLGTLTTRGTVAETTPAVASLIALLIWHPHQIGAKNQANKD